jgi:hypothetical protein
MRSGGRPPKVRFAPKATVSDRTATCRNGPKEDILRKRKGALRRPFHFKLEIESLGGGPCRRVTLLPARQISYEAEPPANSGSVAVYLLNLVTALL